MTCLSVYKIAIVASVMLLASSCSMLNDDPVAPVAAELGDPVDVEFTSSLDQTPQRYVKRLLAGFDPRRRHDVPIALHGMGSDRWQYATHPRDECRGARAIAAKYDMIYITPDYRGPNSGMNSQAEADMLQIIPLSANRQRRRK